MVTRRGDNIIEADDWHLECFASRAEAEAFALGLAQAGDTYTIDSIERCKYPQEGRTEEWGCFYIRTIRLTPRFT